MKKKSLFQNQSQELHRLFEEAGNHGKVLCVPIDYCVRHAQAGIYFGLTGHMTSLSQTNEKKKRLNSPSLFIDSLNL